MGWMAPLGSKRFAAGVSDSDKTLQGLGFGLKFRGLQHEPEGIRAPKGFGPLLGAQVQGIKS